MGGVMDTGEAATAKQPKPKKQHLSGGFWRRAIAVLLDSIIIGVILVTGAMLAYAPTGGLVRIAKPVFSYTECEPAARLPVDAELPQGFRVDRNELCVVTLFGQEVNRRVHIAQVDVNGSVTTTHDHNFAVNKAGRVVEPFFVDQFWGMTGLVLFSILEGLLGFTLGKALAGLKVVNHQGRPAGLLRAVARNTLIYGGWAISGGLSAFEFFVHPVSLGAAGDGVLTLVIIVWELAVFVGIIFFRPDPFYDVWAGTRVEATRR